MSGWHRYWLIWFACSFAAFLGPEIYALRTNWRNTLSAAVWSLEDFKQGQAVSAWTFAHYAFIGVYGLLVLWLFFHFGLGWWR